MSKKSVSSEKVVELIASINEETKRTAKIQRENMAISEEIKRCTVDIKAEQEHLDEIQKDFEVEMQSLLEEEERRVMLESELSELQSSIDNLTSVLSDVHMATQQLALQDKEYQEATK